MHEPAVPVTGRQEEDSSGKAGQRNANENITYRRRRGMISVGLDLHKKTAQIAAMDKDGTVLFNRKIPHTREAIKAEVDRLPKHAKYTVWNKFVTVSLFEAVGSNQPDAEASVLASAG